MFAASLTASLTGAVASCGGGGGGSDSTTTAPLTVTTVTVAPNATSLPSGLTAQLSATAASKTGTPVAGLTATWQSSSNAVATVSASGLVTAALPGTATITATMGGVSGTAAITVTAIAFAPTASASLGGTQHFSSLTVPAGVTITATSDLDLRVDSVATLSGALTGNCVKVALSVAGALVATGNISNACADSTAPRADLRIVAANFSFTNDTVRAGGNLLLTNDSTLTSATNLFRAAQRAALSQSTSGTRTANATTTPQGCNISGSTIDGGKGVWGATLGARGGSGGAGGAVTVRCRGDLLISATVYGGLGGQGGRGDDAGSNNPANGAGGNGGVGGAVAMIATGSILLGARTAFYGGSGGDGGWATATSSIAGASARAFGGTGGDAAAGAFITLTAGVKITTSGSVSLAPGSAGNGGKAFAYASNGADAAGSVPAQVGGTATATGGSAGRSDGTAILSAPDVGGVIYQFGFTYSGVGGDALATAGKGGSGNTQNRNGANAGDATANAGAGEASNARFQGSLMKNGGNGGIANVDGGKGGDGFGGCVAGGTSTPGGSGGIGGSAFGSGGVGGVGIKSGSNGNARTSAFGIGGNGASGLPPGAPGSKGLDLRTGDARTDAGSFKDGAAGAACPGSATYNGTYSGHASLGTNNTVGPTNVPTSVHALPLCVGSSSEYAQGMSTTFDPTGTGSVQMSDSPSFPRIYNGTISGTGTFMSSGTFLYFGTNIPGWLGMTFSADGKTITFAETTQWGTCANTYTGTLTKP